MRVEVETKDSEGREKRLWRFYGCQRCGGVVSAWARGADQTAQQIFPDSRGVNDSLPDKARAFLGQAMDTLHAPAGAIMLAASAVDAMLKEKGYKTGSLYTRIDKAAREHLITKEMALWAHDVRLDANSQRHADDGANLPTAEEACRSVDFAEAFGEFLFVLPSRVTRGRESAKEVLVSSAAAAQ